MTAEAREASTLDERYQALRGSLAALPGIAIAFSGGVDSTFLAKVASDVLGKRVLAITALSDLFPAREADEAAEFCREQGIRQIPFEYHELDVEGFASNPPDRCYLCKTAILSAARDIAEREGFEVLADGSNADDADDYRPGSRAVKEQGVISPLYEAGLSKADIRALSRDLGLPTWDKPAMACLASRIPYGDLIDAEKLHRIETAEDYLHGLGLSQLRVRMHGDIARIEVPPEEFGLLTGVADKVVERLRDLGFAYVTLDLQGYRMGSLNEGHTDWAAG